MPMVIFQGHISSFIGVFSLVFGRENGPVRAGNLEVGPPVIIPDLG